jgi:regulator of nucleoside diphosphate kinase
MIGSRTPLASLLRRKLGSAVIMLPSDAGPDRVSIGRRVRFSIDRAEMEERTLVWEPQPRDDDVKLSVWQPRGLALLGLSIGQSIAYETAGGRTEFLEVDFVFPEDLDAMEMRSRSARKVFSAAEVPAN